LTQSTNAHSQPNQQSIIIDIYVLNLHTCHHV
jgi:hypothetical protein